MYDVILYIGGIFMKQNELTLEPMSFGAMLKKSAGEIKNVRSLVTCAMLIALCVALSLLKIPVLGGMLHIKFTYLIYALSGLLYGPVMTAILGIGDQLIAETLLAGNAPLLGFIFSFALRGFFFGLVFYYPNFARYSEKFGFLRISFCKVADTAINNIVINTALLYHYGWITADSVFVAILARVGKNLVLLPFEILLLAIFLRAMMPIMTKLKLLPKMGELKITKLQVAFAIALALAGLAAVVIYGIVKM